MITAQHKSNLKQLADYHGALPIGYSHFSMSGFHWSVSKGSPIGFETPIKIILEQRVSECGAVACVIGHSADAGLPIVKLDGTDLPDWDGTSEHNFGCSLANPNLKLKEAFEWMFGAGWANTDNSPHGAAKRIYWYLEHGTPTDWEEQMHGNTNILCYEIPFPYS